MIYDNIEFKETRELQLYIFLKRIGLTKKINLKLCMRELKCDLNTMKVTLKSLKEKIDLH